MDFFKKDELNKLQQENAKLKLKISELEENINNLNSIINGYKAKEESISSAIVFAVERSNQLEASRKKLYQLDIQRSRLLYMRMEQVLNELYSRYPELKKDSKIQDMSEKFKQAVYSQTDVGLTDNFNNQSKVKEDPIRKLLNNIINYIDEEKEVKTIRRADRTFNIPNPSVYDKSTSANLAYASSPSTSGFDINEALHPAESLDEILKAFDLGDNKKKKN